MQQLLPDDGAAASAARSAAAFCRVQSYPDLVLRHFVAFSAAAFVAFRLRHFVAFSAAAFVALSLRHFAAFSAAAFVAFSLRHFVAFSGRERSVCRLTWAWRTMDGLARAKTRSCA
jgi:hypothetical protein